jgi:hypothetical protein
LTQKGDPESCIVHCIDLSPTNSAFRQWPSERKVHLGISARQIQAAFFTFVNGGAVPYTVVYSSIYRDLSFAALSSYG